METLTAKERGLVMNSDIVDQVWEAQGRSMRQQIQLLQYEPFDPLLSYALQTARDLMKPVSTASNPINVEDAKSVKVGDVYLVNVITSQQEMNLDLPVLGPVHEDCEVPEMNADLLHWHVDWRFIPDMLYQVIVRAFGKASGGATEDLPLLLMHVIPLAAGSSAPQRRALRCARPHSHFKATAQPWLAALEQVNLGKRVCDDICPHRGFSLVGAVELPNGVRLCPGHGLAWSKDGELVRQTT